MSALAAQAQGHSPASGTVLQAEIVPQPVNTALAILARQSGLQLIYGSETVRGLQSKGAPAGLSPRDALAHVLEGTGLTYEFINDHTVTIVAPGMHKSVTAEGKTSSVVAGEGADGDPQAGRSKESWDRFRVAQAEQAAPGSQVTTAQGPTAERIPLEEVVVTAQKRKERLQDVPVPVTAVNASVLTDTNQTSIADYYTRIPGLSLTPTGFGGPQVTIRGITTGGFANPTVGVVVDDVPYGSSTNIGGLGSIVPDVDPSDLARVEVLRGPQGTLYGASAMGGLLNFVTNDPSTAGVSGHVQATASDTNNSNSMGYGFRGTVNVPLGDSLAALASGFTRRDPGYIDNVETGQKGANTLNVSGGRLTALWRPSDAVSLKLSALLQYSSSDGSDDINPSFGDLKQSKLADTGGYSKHIEVYTATLHSHFAGIDLVSVSGYNINHFSFSSDYTPFYGSSVEGTPLFEQNKTDKFTQEIRLSASAGARIDWLLGAFYTHEKSSAIQQLYAEDLTTLTDTALLYYSSIPSTVAELAGFGDLTFHVTERFDVQIGGRESNIRQSQSQATAGTFVGAVSVTPESASNANAFTYLLTPRFKLSQDLMVYARIASGYRAGGPNPNITLFTLPHSFDPDKTQNYELGIKGQAWERRVSFDASLYYIDWKDIQLQVLNNGFLYYTNGSAAKSEGIELSGEVHPVEGFSVSAWVALNDAVLRDALPPGSAALGTYGAAGDRLPDSSRFSGNLSVEDEYPLGRELRGTAGIALSYQSTRFGNFVGAPPAAREIFPAYARLDLHAGILYAGWAVNLFANNVANRRGVLAQDVTPDNFLYIQPRTIGLNVKRTF